MPLELEEAQDDVRRARSMLRAAVRAGREQLAAGRTLSPQDWRVIDGLAGTLERSFGRLEQSERAAGLR